MALQMAIHSALKLVELLVVMKAKEWDLEVALQMAIHSVLKLDF